MFAGNCWHSIVCVATRWYCWRYLLIFVVACWILLLFVFLSIVWCYLLICADFVGVCWLVVNLFIAVNIHCYLLMFAYAVGYLLMWEMYGRLLLFVVAFCWHLFLYFLILLTRLVVDGICPDLLIVVGNCWSLSAFADIRCYSAIFIDCCRYYFSMQFLRIYIDIHGFTIL